MKNRFNTDNIEIIQSAFEEVDWSKQPKFDVVHFDVMPITEKTYDDFFNLVTPALAKTPWLYLLNNQIICMQKCNAAILKHTDKVTETFKDTIFRQHE